ncbi:MAG: hypothetical protein KGJ80_03460 [Chloroflexota bacterium]|nr:hypothetical protein [Chloroflexota bacterium]
MAQGQAAPQSSNNTVKIILIVVAVIVVLCILTLCCLFFLPVLLEKWLPILGPQIGNIFSKVTSGLSAP